MALLLDAEAQGLTSSELDAPSCIDAPRQNGLRSRRCYFAAAVTLGFLGLAFTHKAQSPRAQASGPTEEFVLDLDLVPKPHVPHRRNLNLSAVAMRQLGATCEKVVRYEALGKQEVIPEHDDMFPDSMISIGKVGGECGHTPEELKKNCGQYNTWVKFEDIAKKRKKPFKVMAAGGPKFADIDQGSLGDCYFLTALASLARTHPKVIQRAFVNRKRWADGIYTTRWLLHGREVLVEVDHKIPGREWRPHFAGVSETGEWWPVIMEKAWAKIFSDFKATASGKWMKVIRAITMAPVYEEWHSKKPASQIFDFLKWATENGWPMSATSGPACVKYKVVDNHAYTVLAAREDATYGPVVDLFNPWHIDNYRGAIPNEKREDGVFTMKLEEYYEAFILSYLAQVEDDYKVSLTSVQTEAEGLSAWEVSMAGPKPFYVSLNYPTARLMVPCAALNPTALLVVAKKASGGRLEQVAMAHEWVRLEAAQLNVTSGPGDYVILAGLSFTPEDKVHEGNLAIYSAEEARIKKGSKESLLSAAQFPMDEQGNICPVITIKRKGLFYLRKDKVMRGLPTYFSHDEVDFVYRNGVKWTRLGIKNWDKAAILGYPSNVIDADISCGCEDSETVVGFSNIHCNHEVISPGNKYSNVACHNVQYSAMVQRYCPKLCGVQACMPTVMPTLLPTLPPVATLLPLPTLPGLKECKDERFTGIRLHKKDASCSELGAYCADYPFVQERCCATCWEIAAGGGWSDRMCRDEKLPSPLIEETTGMVLEDCSQADERWCQSQMYGQLVRQECCATCGAADSQCWDHELPAVLHDGKGGSLHHCADVDRNWCESESLGQLVREECCASCHEVLKRALGDYAQCQNHELAQTIPNPDNPADHKAHLYECPSHADEAWCNVHYNREPIAPKGQQGQGPTYMRRECCATCQAVAKAKLPDYAKCEDHVLPYPLHDPSIGVLRDCFEVKKQWCTSKTVGPIVRQECCDRCEWIMNNDVGMDQCEDTELSSPIPDPGDMGEDLTACAKVSKAWCEHENWGQFVRDVCCASCQVLAKADFPEYAQCQDHGTFLTALYDESLGKIRDCSEVKKRWCVSKTVGPLVRQDCCHTCEWIASSADQYDLCLDSAPGSDGFTELPDPGGIGFHLKACSQVNKAWCENEISGWMVRDMCCASCQALVKAQSTDYTECKEDHNALPYPVFEPFLGKLWGCSEVRKSWCDSKAIGPLVRQDCCRSCDPDQVEDLTCVDEPNYSLFDPDGTMGGDLEDCSKVTKRWCEHEDWGAILRSMCCASCQALAKAEGPR